jgi:hypothetical protein
MKVKNINEIIKKGINLKTPFFGIPYLYISEYGLEIVAGYPLEFCFRKSLDKPLDLDPDLTLSFLKELEKEINEEIDTHTHTHTHLE